MFPSLIFLQLLCKHAFRAKTFLYKSEIKWNLGLFVYVLKAINIISYSHSLRKILLLPS